MEMIYMYVFIEFRKIKKILVALLFITAVFISSKSIFDRRSILTMGGSDTKGYMAIIIDDFGYNGEGTEKMLSLDIPFTAAVMPFSPNTYSDLEKIKSAGKDYIIHMPMESLTGKKEWVGEKGVFTNMTDEEIKKVVREAFNNVKGACGINNHMGSAVMENKRCLSAVLDVVAEENAIFIDSVTTSESFAQELCASKGISLFKRSVFLDSTDDINKICENIKKSGEIAEKSGFSIAIGHVGPEGGSVTAEAIQKMRPYMEERGIKFVGISFLKDLEL